jgi:membrane protein CcdC involved in cytochrome C biogenesis
MSAGMMLSRMARSCVPVLMTIILAPSSRISAGAVMLSCPGFHWKSARHDRSTG